MATADQYAEWIVKNKDKQGTREFEVVAQAYKEAKAQESQQPQQAVPLRSPETPEVGFGQGMLGLGETALTMGTGAVTTPVAGLAGLLLHRLPSD